MNFQEFFDRVTKQPKPAGMREGQHWSNQLFEASPIAYSRIPTELDPFYGDVLIQSFLWYLEDNWETLTTPLHSPALVK